MKVLLWRGHKPKIEPKCFKLTYFIESEVLPKIVGIVDPNGTVRQPRGSI